MRFGIWLYDSKDGDLSVTRQVVEELTARGAECWAPLDQRPSRLPHVTAVGSGKFFSGLDALVVLGGDGSMLAAAREGARFDVPMLGINLGHHGFMTECEPSDMVPALTALTEGSYSLDRRMMLRARVLDEGGRCLWQTDALNDVVLCNALPVQMIHAEASIGDLMLERWACDSMVVASPTGSTAYSMTAGGPVIHPDMPCMVLTPVCAGSLTARPMVLPGNERLTLRMTRPHQEGLAVADGQNRFPVLEGRVLTVERSPYTTALIRVAPYNFYRTLRTKRDEWARNETLNL